MKFLLSWCVQSGVDVSAAAYRCELIPATGCESLLKPTAARLHTHPHPSSQTHFIPISCLLVRLNGNNGLLANQRKTKILNEIQDLALQRWVQERDVKTKRLYCRQMPWDRLYRKDLAYFTFCLGGGGGGGGVTVAYGTTPKVLSWPVVGYWLLMWRLLSTNWVAIMWKT